MEEKGYFDSKEFQEMEDKFCVGLQEDVREWDSYQNLIFSIYEQGKKDERMGR